MKKIIAAVLLLILAATGCGKTEKRIPIEEKPSELATIEIEQSEKNKETEATTSETESASELLTGDGQLPYEIGYVEAPPFQAEDIPAYDGALSVIIHEGVPFFEKRESTGIYIRLSELDALGRAGAAEMIAGPETIRHGERSSTGMAKPSGWHQARYEGLVDSDPPYLYNRCHILMWYLTGLTDTKENLITGTRKFNAEGMLSFELAIGNYINQTGHHVQYRSTPVYEGNDLLARGILLEARSIEDDGFIRCEFIYNVQPGVKINYATGENEVN